MKPKHKEQIFSVGIENFRKLVLPHDGVILKGISPLMALSTGIRTDPLQQPDLQELNGKVELSVMFLTLALTGLSAGHG